MAITLEALTLYFYAHNPRKASPQNVKTIIEIYKGRDEALCAALALKYGETLRDFVKFSGSLYSFFARHNPKKAHKQNMIRIMYHYGKSQQRSALYAALEEKYGANPITASIRSLRRQCSKIKIQKRECKVVEVIKAENDLARQLLPLPLPLPNNAVATAGRNTLGSAFVTSTTSPTKYAMPDPLTVHVLQMQDDGVWRDDCGNQHTGGDVLITDPTNAAKDANIAEHHNSSEGVKDKRKEKPLLHRSNSVPSSPSYYADATTDGTTITSAIYRRCNSFQQCYLALDDAASLCSTTAAESTYESSPSSTASWVNMWNNNRATENENKHQNGSESDRDRDKMSTTNNKTTCRYGDRRLSSLEREGPDLSSLIWSPPAPEVCSGDNSGGRKRFNENEKEKEKENGNGNENGNGSDTSTVGENGDGHKKGGDRDRVTRLNKVDSISCSFLPPTLSPTPPTIKNSINSSAASSSGSRRGFLYHQSSVSSLGDVDENRDHDDSDDGDDNISVMSDLFSDSMSILSDAESECGGISYLDLNVDLGASEVAGPGFLQSYLYEMYNKDV